MREDTSFQLAVATGLWLAATPPLLLLFDSLNSGAVLAPLFALGTLSFALGLAVLTSWRRHLAVAYRRILSPLYAAGEGQK